MTRPSWRGAGGGVVVVGVIAGLHLLGSGPLAAPDIGSWPGFRAWLDQHGPITAGMVALRLVALGLSYHLVATTAVALVGRLLDRPNLVRWADAITLPPLRTTGRRLAGLGLTASTVFATPVPAALAGSSPPPGRATLTLVEPAAAPRGTATLGLIEDTTTTSTTTTSTTTTSTTTAAPSTPADPPPAEEVPPAVADIDADATASAAPATSSTSEHTARAGDHLWAIAEASLTDHLGRPPTDAEIAPFWQAVVDANPQLADPDVLFVGDAITVPAPRP